MTEGSLQVRADAGDVEAQCKLALCYEIGIGLPLNYDTAMYWWRKASENGSAWAFKKIHDLITTNKVVGSKDEAVEALAQATKLGYRNSTEEMQLSRPGHSMPSKPQKKKIMILEDEDSIRAVQKELLEKNGYRVVEAADGRSGLAMLSNNPDIALIFCDLIMPIMNGFQFIETLRKLNAAEGVPIVIITGNSKPEYIEKAKKLGIKGWLMKPFADALLIQTVQSLLVTAKK